MRSFRPPAGLGLNDRSNIMKFIIDITKEEFNALPDDIDCLDSLFKIAFRILIFKENPFIDMSHLKTNSIIT